MGWRVNWYNKRSAKKYNWKPIWFKATDFNQVLELRVKDFQAEHGLKQDGMVGPKTYRRILTRIERLNAWRQTEENTKGVLCNGVIKKVGWDNIKIDLIKGLFPGQEPQKRILTYTY